MEPLDVDSVLARLRRLLDRIAGPGADLVIDHEVGLPPVRFDPGAFRLMLVELVRVGSEMTGGGGRILVRACAQDDCVVLTVADSGPGGPVDDLPRPSEPFHAATSRGATAEAGLAAVHDLVAANGAVIEVAATPGGGSRFSIYLPLWD
jgi:signal transduction histidine kinase